MIRRNSPAYLITAGLGYCCPWMFFRLFAKKDSVLIATRLGCSPRAVRNARKNPGECQCKVNCSRKFIPTNS